MKKILISFVIILSMCTPASACDLQKMNVLINVASTELSAGEYCNAYKLYQRTSDILIEGMEECIEISDKTIMEVLMKKLNELIELSYKMCGMKGE